MQDRDLGYDEMRDLVERPRIMEGYQERVASAAAALVERFCEKHPGRIPVLSHEWDTERWVMTLTVSDGGPAA